MGYRLQLTWRGNTRTVHVEAENPSLQELGRAIEEQLGASYETLKLLVPGVKGYVAPSKSPEKRALEAGVVNDCKALLVASSAADVERVRTSRDATGIRGFDDELKRAARRRRTAANAANLHPPKAEYTFGDYQAWERPGLHPPPAEALKLLYRLANDPGILGVMAAHRYRVGLLSEMPPEGKVGVSPVCILGVNINAGQEVSLRLRTDDLKGFRKYERIRETLIHELAHMEYGEHDNSFKQLNSQLGRECEAINSRYSTARTLLGGLHAAAGGGAEDQATAASELDAAWLLEDENDVMAATARLSGRTLRQLAGASANSSSGTGATRGGTSTGAGVGVGDRGAAAGTSQPLPLPARAAAAAAALSRLGASREEVPGPSAATASGAAAGNQPVEALGAAPVASVAPVTDHGMDHAMEDASAVAADVAGAAASSSGSGDDGEAEDGGAEDVRRFEHFDAATDQAEEAARRLGSLDERGLEDGGGMAAEGPEGGGGAEAVEGLRRPGSGAAAAAPVCSADNGALAVAGDPMDIQVSQGVGDTRGDRAAGPAVDGAAGLGEAASRAEGCVSSSAPMDDAAGAAPAVPHPPASPNRHVAPPLRLVVSPPDELSGTEAGGDAAEGTTAIGGDGSGGGADDIVQQKARRAWAAVTQLVGATAAPVLHHTSHAAPPAIAQPVSSATITPADVVTALDTLETMLGNAAHFPKEERYRRVRLGNAALQRRLGRLPGGLELLRVAGFVEEKDGAVGAAAGGAAGVGQGEAVMRLRRDDPGLLWLVLSVVREARRQVEQQLATAAAGGGA